MCVYVYEIESRAKDARKVFEQPQAARKLTPGAHKRYSKMAKSNENILLPDFDDNYILNGFMRA